MCELLGHCKPGAPALRQRSQIQLQRVRENNAYAHYHEIRGRLLEAARVGYESTP